MDGAGSGLDADTLDGRQGAWYRDAGNLNAGTLPAARLARANLAAARAGTSDVLTMTPRSTRAAIEAAVPSRNVVQKHVTATVAYAKSTDRHLAALDHSITIRGGSKVLMRAVVDYDASGNGAFYVKRDGVEIASAPAAGNRMHGMRTGVYNGQHHTTPKTVSIVYMDDPSVTVATTVKYSLHYRHDRDGGTSFHINRGQSDVNTDISERSTSTVILEEIT